jgi:hypothetical protein
MAEEVQFETDYRQEADGFWTARGVFDGKEIFCSRGFVSEAAVVKVLNEFVRQCAAKGYIREVRRR